VYVKETSYRSSQEVHVRCQFAEVVTHESGRKSGSCLRCDESWKQSQAQAVAAAAAQIEFLKVVIKDDKADKAANLQSTSDLEVEVITGNAVQDKYPGNIVQKMPQSFVQLQSVHQRVVAFLQQRGLALSSRPLPSFAYLV